MAVGFRRGARHWSAAGLTLALLAIGTAAEPTMVRRPNFLVVNVDDLDERAISLMPQIRSALVREGVSFARAFVTTPNCCPSRASFLRGQYAHNHGVLSNRGEFGGFRRFRELGLESSTLATWLQDAGYRTALVGKYLNAYSLRTAGTHVPPGWDDWFAHVRGKVYYDYSMLHADGRVESFGRAPDDYRTDVEARRLLQILRDAAAGPDPFFLYWAPVAPHSSSGEDGAGPPTPAPRHRHAFADLAAPEVCALDEVEIDDKPPPVANRSPFSDADRALLDEFYRGRLRSMLAVDEAVGRLVGELERLGLLEDTYVVFTSDNGFHLGEHRILVGKGLPYEESLRVPLVVRGPGVARGRPTMAMALNLDLAPTIAELAGVVPPLDVDGRSLATVLRRPRRVPGGWRTGFLAEHWEEEFGRSIFQAIRGADAKVVQWGFGRVETYDLRQDPYEMDNLRAVGSTTRVQDALFGGLAGTLPALAECAGQGCRDLEAALPSARGPLLRVLSQNGNEALRPGERRTIRWASRGVRAVRIELLRDARKLLTIAERTRSDGRFRWRVPGDLAPDGRYKIRVKDLGTAPAVKDAADAAAFVRR